MGRHPVRVPHLQAFASVALTVIGTLAVALGLNATAYAFFNAYVVKPAAVRDPGTLYQASSRRVWSRRSTPRGGRREWNPGWR